MEPGRVLRESARRAGDGLSGGHRRLPVPSRRAPAKREQRDALALSGYAVQWRDRRAATATPLPSALALAGAAAERRARPRAASASGPASARAHADGRRPGRRGPCRARHGVGRLLPRRRLRSRERDTPADAGRPAAASTDAALAANENRLVRGEGMLGAAGGIRYERPFVDDTFRTLPVAGQRSRRHLGRRPRAGGAGERAVGAAALLHGAPRALRRRGPAASRPREGDRAGDARAGPEGARGSSSTARTRPTRDGPSSWRCSFSASWGGTWRQPPGSCARSRRRSRVRRLPLDRARQMLKSECWKGPCPPGDTGTGRAS